MSGHIKGMIWIYGIGRVDKAYNRMYEFLCDISVLT